MKALVKVLALVLFLVPATASGQSLDVTVAEVATAIVDRMPEGSGSSFAADVGQLYFFTRVTGAEAGTEVHHVWMHGMEERARVTLTLGGPNWRTWSSKSILPEWTGEWRVEVQTADGTVLESASFTIG